MSTKRILNKPETSIADALEMLEEVSARARCQGSGLVAYPVDDVEAVCAALRAVRGRDRVKAVGDPEPLYYVKDGEVHKRPVRTPKDGGGATISIGFPVCTMTEFVGTDGAQFIADALNSHDTGTR